MTGRSWWGWGREEEHLDHDSLAGLATMVADQFGLDHVEVRRPASVADLDLPSPRIEPPAALARACSTETEFRAAHALGMAYRDVVRAFHGDLRGAPDVVAAPTDEATVADVLEWCADVGAAAVVHGGGTSVVGGVNMPEGGRPVVSLDTRALQGVVDIDVTSRAANIRAGTLGPAIEDALRPEGLTLRFFPQSWEFSSLGGWIATRAGGHFATRLTHIDDLVESVRAITPAGGWETRRLPADGAGPSPDRLLLGSEGTLGVITSAWVRLQDRPVFRAAASVRFPDVGPGLEAVRAVAQAGLSPANCRLLDPTEAALAGAGQGDDAVLLIGFESAHHPVRTPLGQALDLARDHGGTCPDGPQVREGESGDGGAAGRDDATGSWRETFLRAPYLRDALVALGMVVETFETAVTWDRVRAGFVDEVMQAATAAATEVCGSALVAVRTTHAYPDGVAPYFTVIAPGRRGSEVAQWDAIKAAVSDVITARGGTITHHHAVGRDHRPWYDRERPEPFAAAFRAAKAAVDPDAILNPGVLIDPGRRFAPP